MEDKLTEDLVHISFVKLLTDHKLSKLAKAKILPVAYNRLMGFGLKGREAEFKFLDTMLARLLKSSLSASAKSKLMRLACSRLKKVTREERRRLDASIEFSEAPVVDVPVVVEPAAPVASDVAYIPVKDVAP